MGRSVDQQANNSSQWVVTALLPRHQLKIHRPGANLMTVSPRLTPRPSCRRRSGNLLNVESARTRKLILLRELLARRLWACLSFGQVHQSRSKTRERRRQDAIELLTHQRRHRATAGGEERDTCSWWSHSLPCLSHDGWVKAGAPICPQCPLQASGIGSTSQSLQELLVSLDEASGSRREIFLAAYPVNFGPSGVDD